MFSARLAIAAVGLALLAAACVPVTPPPPPPPPPPPSGLAPPPPDIATSPSPAPNLAPNTSFITGIDHPWDIAFTPDGTTGLFTERIGRISKFDPVTGVKTLLGTVANVQQNGESGLLGMAVDPAFATNHFIYVCVSSTTPSANNQLRRFTLDFSQPVGSQLTAETVLLQGMPVNSFHDGCRVRFQPGTSPPALFITMGDAGMGPGPQDLTSLAGKILRVEVDTGSMQAYPGNPFIGSANVTTKLIYTYGHRNPQGIAFQPGSNTAYDAEHGPSINDEVNRLVPAGGNAGWDPNTNGNYDQSVPMTDLAKFPSAIRPAWRSGDSFTLAPSGATFLSGPQWKSWNGALAVAFLKDSKVRIMFLDGAGAVTGAYPTLALGFRVRSVVQGPDGSLYVSTDNGSNNDAIWHVVPS